MKPVELIRLCRGYVTFQAKGGFSERFINLCAGNNIGIWDVSCIDGSLWAKISVGNFKKLRSVARKTGAKIKIREKKGLPFFIRSHSDRAGLAVGALFCLTFMVVMNRFVWCIDASGSDKYSPSQIISVAETVGVKHGLFVSFFDEEKAAREIYKAFNNELSFVAVNIKGSLAFIEVRDTVKADNIEIKGDPCNIVADFDGVILSDETYAGVPNIGAGNGVKKGDLLISGVVDNMDLSVTYYEAKGKFTALHKRDHSLNMPKTDKISTYTNIRKYYEICFFGIRIPLGYRKGDKACHIFQREEYLRYNGYILPFGYREITAAGYDRKAQNKDNAYLFAAEAYTDESYDEFRNTNILSYKVTLTSDNSSVRVKGEYECIDFIGVKQPINKINSDFTTENMEK